MEEERPIEQVLRQSAEHNRQSSGAPPELDAAARRLLRGEVARQYPRTHGSAPVWPAWWPRFALGLGLAMVAAALAVYVLGPEPEPYRTSPGPLAWLEQRPEDALAEGVRDIPGGDLSKAQAPASAGGSAAAPASVSAEPPRPTAANSLASGAAPAPGSTSTFAAAPSAPSIGNTQLYNNSAPISAVANNSRAALVMASFKVEQAGNVIRIIDQDGSVYTGQLQPLPQPAPASRSAKAPRASKAPAPAARNFSFRAAGLNLSLNERVQFSGNLAVEAKATVAPRGRVENRARDRAGVIDNAGALMNSRITGKAQVGAGDFITVEAVAVDVHK